MWPPAGSSTGTSCTTSTSRGAGSASRGPSITPRPPQGQPVVSALAHGPVALPARRRARADIGYRHPARRRRRPGDRRRDPRRAGGRRAGGPETVRVFADLVVFLDDGRRRGGRPQGPARRARGLRVHAATPPSSPGHRHELADLLQDWQAAGLTGFRLRPGAIPHDLAAITRGPGAGTAEPRRLPPAPTRHPPCAGCSAWPAPPTATPPPDAGLEGPDHEQAASSRSTSRPISRA